MHSFTIKDLENLSGIKAHTLRIWEQRYNFLKPQRSFTNIRNYSNEELKIILNISLLNKNGYKISHIDKMSAAEMNEKILSLDSVAQQERFVNDLIQQMIDFEMEVFENLLQKQILTQGMEKTIVNIIFPFLQKIGILWTTNHIIPAQEHLVSNIIRQKLISEIDKLSPVIHINKTIILFLPESEHHELGLLFIHYLMKARGIKVIYLGANVPIKDVAFLCSIKKPDYIYTHLTAVAESFNFSKFIVEISKSFSQTPIILSGALPATFEKKIHPPVYLKRSYTEVLAYINSI